MHTHVSWKLKRTSAITARTSGVKVHLTLDHEQEAVLIRTEAQTVSPTGVEMEALTGACGCARLRSHVTSDSRHPPRAAAAVAGLTVYDMVKAVTKDAVLTDVQLEAKSGGRSGTYSRCSSGAG